MTVNINPSTHQVGSFFYNHQTKEISGPADYMADRFQDRMEKIYAGRDAVFNYGSANPVQGGPDAVSLVLVSLQTDYAAYLGMKSFGRGVTS